MQHADCSASSYNYILLLEAGTLRHTQTPASNLTQALCLQEKAPAVKKSSQGKSEVPASAPAQVKKPAKATPKTPVETKQVACHARKPRVLSCNQSWHCAAANMFMYLPTLMCAVLRFTRFSVCQLCCSAAIWFGCSDQCNMLPSQQLTLLSMIL